MKNIYNKLIIPTIVLSCILIILIAVLFRLSDPRRNPYKDKNVYFYTIWYSVKNSAGQVTDKVDSGRFSSIQYSSGAPIYEIRLGEDGVSKELWIIPARDTMYDEKNQERICETKDIIQVNRFDVLYLGKYCKHK